MVPALVLRRKSEESFSGEKKRRLSERSEFLRFRRRTIRSRLKNGSRRFFFLLLFLLAAQKKK